MRVRCTFRYHPREGKLATVVSIADRHIVVKWDDNYQYDLSWSYEDSFEPLESPPKRKAKKSAKLKKELEMLEAKSIKRERDISRIYYLRKQCETL